MRNLGLFLKDAWRLAVPHFRSEERWSARGLLAAIIVRNLSMVGMDVIFNFWNGRFYDALQDKNWRAFINLLLFYQRTEKGGIMPGFIGLAAVYILVAVYRTYLNQWLQIRWRRWMTERFLNEWLGDRVYYRNSLESFRATADLRFHDTGLYGVGGVDLCRARHMVHASGRPAFGGAQLFAAAL